MQKPFLLLTIFLFAVSVNYSQKIKLRNIGFAKIALTKGNLRSTISLEKEVAGCSYVSGGVKRDLDVKGCAAPPASFQLVDVTVKKNQTFVVVASDAAGNCNACGQCGASEAFSVVWLKLDKNLRLLEKKSVPVEFCRANVSMISDYLTLNEENQDETLKLPFKNDVLTIEFEETNFYQDDRKGYKFSHLEYNRKTPEKGFFIKTERRDKSSMPEGQ